MKLFIVLIASLAMVLAGKLTEEQMEALEKDTALCVEQEGITADQAKALRAGKFDDVDQKVKCYANCMMERIGFMVDGQMKPEAVLAKMGKTEDAEAVKTTLAKCGAIKGSDKCDTAFQYYQCFHKHHPLGN